MADLYVQWSFRNTEALRCAVAQKKPFLILDGGFFADRDSHFGLSFNGFMNLADYVEPPEGTRPHPRPLDWNENGDTIVVYGQVPTDKSLRGLDHDQWVADTMREAKAAYPEYRVKFRPHPNVVKGQPPMEADFERMYTAVTYTSTAGVQTAVAGIRTVCMHPAAMATPVSSAELGSPIRVPGRQLWLRDLSWRQYGDDEIEAAADYIRHAFPQILSTPAKGTYDLEGIR
jgi:hypothetical protein